MPVRKKMIIHRVLISIINWQCQYLLRMLVGIWFTHNYFYHKPRWRLRVAGGGGVLPGMLKNPFCPGQVSRR